MTSHKEYTPQEEQELRDRLVKSVEHFLEFEPDAHHYNWEDPSSEEEVQVLLQKVIQMMIDTLKEQPLVETRLYDTPHMSDPMLVVVNHFLTNLSHVVDFLRGEVILLTTNKLQDLIEGPNESFPEERTNN